MRSGGFDGSPSRHRSSTVLGGKEPVMDLCGEDPPPTHTHTLEDLVDGLCRWFPLVEKLDYDSKEKRGPDLMESHPRRGKQFSGRFPRLLFSFVFNFLVLFR